MNPDPVHSVEGPLASYNGAGSRPSTYPVQQESASLNKVLRNFGEVVGRINEMEARAEELIRKQQVSSARKGSANGSTQIQEPDEYSDILERVQALERHLAEAFAAHPRSRANAGAGSHSQAEVANEGKHIEVVVRIGDTETRVEDVLREQQFSATLRGSANGFTQKQGSNGDSVLGSAEPPQGGLSRSSVNTSRSTANIGVAPGSEVEVRDEETDPELRQIRIQNRNLANQLARTERRLQKALELRERREKRRRWWRNLTHLLRITRPNSK